MCLIEFFKINKYFFVLTCSVLLCSCQQSASTPVEFPSSVAVSSLEVSALYSGSLTISNQPLSGYVSSISLSTASGCKLGSSAANIVFPIPSGVVTSSSSQTSDLVFAVGEDNCSVTMSSLVVTLNGSSFTYTGSATGVTNGAFALTASQLVASDILAPSSYIYVNFKISPASIVSGVASAPSMTLVYGTQMSDVESVANSGFYGVALTATSASGTTIAAPSYCIGSAAGVCAASNLSVSVNGSNVLQGDQFYLYPSAASGSQLGNSYKMFSITNAGALVSGGVFNSSIVTAIAPGNIPASSSCGVVGSAVTTGCTYSVIDGLWNATSGVSTTVSGSTTGATTFTQSISAATGITTITSVSGSLFQSIGYSIGSTASTSASSDPFGVGISSTSPSSSTQSAIRYLVIRYLDSATSGKSYQLFILNIGR